MLRVLVLLCCLAGLAALDFGTPELVRADLRVGPIGSDGRAMALVRFTIAPEWHIYWTNPGDSGLAPKLEWTLPRGWSAAAPQHPAPKRHVDAGLVTWVHEGAPTLLVELAAPPGTPGGDVELRLDWLVCKEACIPGKAVLRATLGADTASAAEIAAARDLLPRRSAEAGASITVRRDGTGLDLRVVGLRPTAFAPAEEGRFAGDLPSPEADGDGWRLRLPVAAGREVPDRLAGLLLDGGRGVAVDTAIEAAPANISAPATGIGLGTAIIAGLIGGLILNLMPCVLPVLSLKFLAMARLREAGGSPLRHAMAYAGGVVATFLALAVGLLILRAVTGTVGWGFQLQEPLVVLALALLFLLVAANLAGLFEVGLAATRVAPGGGSAFLNGALTTIAATPCGAPFASAAFGFAAVAPAAESLAVFAALGVGLALPAVLVAAIPAAGRLLPRPGAWMEDLRKVLAVPMLGAAGWMLWTYAALAGSESSFLVLVVLIPLVVLAAGAYGRWQGGNRGALGLCLAAVIGAGAVTVWVATAPRPQSAEAGAATWESWTPQREAALRAAGTPMLVDYTAAWCLTCQVNKRTTLSDANVLAAAQRKGIALLRADFTARDPAIAASLARHDRASVPTYVITDALGRSTVLPDLLTPGIVLDAFANLRSNTP